MTQARSRLKPTSNPQTGAIAPLFDRLENLNPLDLDSGKDARFLTFDGLSESIMNNLDQILNTRRTAGHDAFNRATSANVEPISDYAFPDFFGLSDFSFFDGATDIGRRQMAKEITSVITYFEPRLHNPTVTIRRIRDNTLSAFADITGDVPFGVHMTRVTFPILIGGDQSPRG